MDEKLRTDPELGPELRVPFKHDGKEADFLIRPVEGVGPQRMVEIEMKFITWHGGDSGAWIGQRVTMRLPRSKAIQLLQASLAMMGVGL